MGPWLPAKILKLVVFFMGKSRVIGQFEKANGERFLSEYVLRLNVESTGMEASRYVHTIVRRVVLWRYVATRNQRCNSCTSGLTYLETRSLIPGSLFSSSSIEYSVFMVGTRNSLDSGMSRL